VPILAIQHLTTYRYRQPVAFGAHRMMFRPRDDDDQRLLDAAYDITPAPRQLTWDRDAFGNFFATAHFADRASELRFESNIRVAQSSVSFESADIDPAARNYPFVYAREEGATVAPFRAASTDQPELARWVARFLRADGSADTRGLLIAMTETIDRCFKHAARHEHGTQAPGETLARGGGSCRDLAMLMVAALRSLGFAARFVSGYLRLEDDDPAARSGGNTHAWVQAYVPGAGWVDFDPSTGMIGNQGLVRVAVVPEPSEAIPLQGTWIGASSDHLAMKVAVRVVTARGEPGVPA
jgi:transglutaminase-like putative cysteine protease